MGIDTYSPGGEVPPESVMVLSYQYRIARQDMTSYAQPKGYPTFTYLGVCAYRHAVVSLAALREENNSRAGLWLESAPIGCEAFSKVTA